MLLPNQLTQSDIEIPPDSVIMNKITEGTQRFIGLSWHDKVETIVDGTVNIGLKLIAAIAVLLIGRWLIKRIDKLIDKIFVKRGIDTSINTFVRNMLRIFGWLILLMIVISILGIKTTSFVALIASAGFAVGMALSGTLQNFAGGVMILLLKPFRTGDYIQAQGYEGTVKEIKLFNSMLVTSDNKTIIIPNGGLSTSIVNNYTQTGTRRVEWTFNISYGDDYKAAKNLLTELIKHDSRILDKPPFFIALQSLSESSVDIVVRAWTASGDFWDVYFDMNEKVYKLFPEHGLSIPYNSIDVNLVNVTSEKGGKKQETKTDKPAATSVKDIIKETGNNTRSEDNSITRDDIHTEKSPGAELPDEKTED